MLVKATLITTNDFSDEVEKSLIEAIAPHLLYKQGITCAIEVNKVSAYTKDSASKLKSIEMNMLEITSPSVKGNNGDYFSVLVLRDIEKKLRIENLLFKNLTVKKSV